MHKLFHTTNQNDKKFKVKSFPKRKVARTLVRLSPNDTEVVLPTRLRDVSLTARPQTWPRTCRDSDARESGPTDEGLVEVTRPTQTEQVVS